MISVKRGMAAAFYRSRSTSASSISRRKLFCVRVLDANHAGPYSSILLIIIPTSSQPLVATTLDPLSTYPKDLNDFVPI